MLVFVDMCWDLIKQCLSMVTIVTFALIKGMNVCVWLHQVRGLQIALHYIQSFTHGDGV